MRAGCAPSITPSSSPAGISSPRPSASASPLSRGRPRSPRVPTRSCPCPLPAGAIVNAGTIRPCFLPTRPGASSPRRGAALRKRGRGLRILPPRPGTRPRPRGRCRHDGRDALRGGARPARGRSTRRAGARAGPHPGAHMTALFDRLVVTALPLVPRSLVRRVASRYVAGDTLDDALATVRALSAEGAMATLDILGESVTRPEQTEATRDQYLRMIDAIAASGLNANISVKPTAVGLAIDPALAAI